MVLSTKRTVCMAMLVLACLLAASCGLRRKEYDNPISKDTQQPDKVLFDKAINDIERGRYEIARLTLQTLMNTYDTSEFMAKAKLAYADSWYREGGSHGLAQAEAEYKDFILFYPAMDEAAEAQEKVCMIHYRQMEKADRDPTHALRAEEECRNLLVQFPNSKFAPRVQQTLRNIQEVIAEGEFRRGAFYHAKGSHPAAANRFTGLVTHYPLYSKSDQANWMLADAYSKMGPRFRERAGEAYARIVRDYPLSGFADDAKKKLASLELPIPEPDPVAYARMKYEMEHRDDANLAEQFWGVLKKGPDVRGAARSGTPAMTSLRPGVPVSVPTAPTGTSGGFSGEVTGSAVSGDAGAVVGTDTTGGNGGGETAEAAPANTPAEPAADAPKPENSKDKKDRKQQKKNK